MESILCPKCEAENDFENPYCRICKYPFRKQAHRRWGLIILTTIMVILALASAATLIYVEKTYPEYGLVKRLKVTSEVLFQGDWIENNNIYKDLSDKVNLKKKELNDLENEIQLKKAERNKLFNFLEERVQDLQKKIDKLDKKEDKK